MSDTPSRVLQAQRLLETGKPEEAYQMLVRILEREPGHANANRVLSRVLYQLGRFFDALHYARAAATAAPTSPDVLVNLGKILALTNRQAESIETYRRALALAPHDLSIRYDLASQLTYSFCALESIAVLQEAPPEQLDGHQLSLALARAQLTAGRAEDAIATLRAAVERHPRDPGLAECYAFTLNYAPDADLSESLRAHVHQAALVRSSLKPLALVGPKPDLDPERPLRIGLISPDFWAHAVATFIEPLLEHFNREQFEFTCYATNPVEDHVTARLRQHANRFRKVAAMGPRDMARLIHADKTDILIDLSGLTASHRQSVMLYQPAPVQATYLGYPSTTGAPTVHYRIVDSSTDPTPTADAASSEKLVQIDPCFLCFRIPEHAPAVSPPPSTAQPFITFGSFNDLKKLNRITLDLFASVLNQVPNSRLVLKNFALSNNDLRADFAQRFADRGLGPDRIELLGPVAESEGHLGAYRRIDIALDTFPYHGTTTTCESLLMGVPVVTLAGDRHASRVGVSLLSNVGLTDCIASSPAHYVQIAVALAADTARLTSLRHSLRDTLAASPLCDAPAFAARMGDALRGMWRSHVASQPAKGGARR